MVQCTPWETGLCWFSLRFSSCLCPPSRLYHFSRALLLYLHFFIIIVCSHTLYHIHYSKSDHLQPAISAVSASDISVNPFDLPERNMSVRHVLPLQTDPARRGPVMVSSSDASESILWSCEKESSSGFQKSSYPQDRNTPLHAPDSTRPRCRAEAQDTRRAPFGNTSKY